MATGKTADWLSNAKPRASFKDRSFFDMPLLERRSRTISCWDNKAKLERGFDSAQASTPLRLRLRSARSSVVFITKV